MDINELKVSSVHCLKLGKIGFKTPCINYIISRPAIIIDDLDKFVKSSFSIDLKNY